MPEHDEDHGKHFRSRLYSADTTNERIESRQPHKGGLVLKAFDANEAVYCRDLKSELEKGNYVRTRDDKDPFRWYRTTILCHFKVQGERWGVLSIDSKDVGSLSDDYKNLACAFADACGIAFSLAEHGDLGNEIYIQKHT